MRATTTLYRPVGQKELDLITETGRFPPRLPIQPIFYPVLTYDYAEKIARGWNTKDEASGFVGYITEFDVLTEFLNQYAVQEAGGRECREYWIPAEELEDFNAAIIGVIRTVAKFEKEG
jgi:hypothetical protein